MRPKLERRKPANRMTAQRVLQLVGAELAADRRRIDALTAEVATLRDQIEELQAEPREPVALQLVREPAET